jgi:DNA-binding transcriptional LysR family regulator
MNTSKTRSSARAFIDPQRIDWNLLKSFCSVAELGSLTRAAGALSISQPTLSRQVAELESVVGAALFERGARGLSMTPAGTVLLEPARRMLAAAQAVTLTAAGQSQDIAGTVRITASETVSAFLLPRILVDLRIEYPDIQVELVASNQVDNLLARDADIAVRMVRPQQAGLIARKIGVFPTGFYAHRDYVASRKTAAGKSELERYDWVGLDRSPQLVDGFRNAGFRIDKTFFGFRCDNHIVGWQAVLSGLGAGISMRCVAKQFPQLVQVLKAQPAPELSMWLSAHRELRSTPRIRAVYDFLAEGLARFQRDS